MTAPPYVWGTLWTFYVSWDSDRRGERGLHIIIPLSCSVVGFIVTVATGNNAARYAMTFLYAAGCFSANTMQYTWAVSTLGQTPEKRAAGGVLTQPRYTALCSPRSSQQRRGRSWHSGRHYYRWRTQ